MQHAGLVKCSVGRHVGGRAGGRSRAGVRPLTYFVDDYRPLCDTIAALLAARPLARAVLAHQRRGLLFRGGRTPGDHHLDHFCAVAAANGLRVAAVPGAAAEAASGVAGENVSLLEVEAVL